MTARSEIDRRVLLGSALAAAAAAAAGGPVLAEVRKTVAKSAAGRRFFTPQEFAMLDEIAEMIIPADDVSAGARATGIAEYLDRRIGESRDPAWRQSWRDDLAEIDRLSREMSGKTFIKASPEQRVRLLERISMNEASPSEAGEYAFGTIKWSVADAYYRTRAGIHDDLKYQGNVPQAEFSGTDVGSR